MSRFNDPLWDESLFDEAAIAELPKLSVSLDAIPTVTLKVESIPSARIEIS